MKTTMETPMNVKLEEYLYALTDFYLTAEFPIWIDEMKINSREEAYGMLKLIGLVLNVQEICVTSNETEVLVGLKA